MSDSDDPGAPAPPPPPPPPGSGRPVPPAPPRGWSAVPVTGSAPGAPAEEVIEHPGLPPEGEHRFPCETCGSDMRYAPGTDELVCDHCGNRRSLGDSHARLPAIRELDFRAALEARLPETEMEDARTSQCPNCGAVIELGDDTQATECPFCATPVVTGTGTNRQIKPRGVVPFALDQDQARDAMVQWLGRLWFAPNGLTDYARKGRRMQGIYVPYWTFDADTRSRYSGARGTVYYTTESYMSDGKMQTRQVQRIRWTPVAGRVARFFDDVLVLASHSLPKRYTDALEPWDLSQLDPYRPEFLAGFRAEAYQVELQDGFTEAREKMDRQIERDVRFDIGGDRQRISHVETEVSDVTFKHVLLPVWLAAYKFRGRTYRFVVNGQTGRVQGERPWSAWKIALAVLLGLILAGVVGYFYAGSR